MRTEHLEELVDVVHVFPNGTVGGAEGADTHLLHHCFPVVKVGVEKDGVG